LTKPRSILEQLAEAAILIFAGLAAFAFTQSIFMLFFVPIVAYFVWALYDKVRELERRLSAMEKPPEEPEQGQS
jgi:cytochrome c-type biogenesis protein CcmH/NrfG